MLSPVFPNLGIPEGATISYRFGSLLLELTRMNITDGAGEVEKGVSIRFKVPGSQPDNEANIYTCALKIKEIELLISLLEIVKQEQPLNNWTTTDTQGPLTRALGITAGPR